MSNQTSHCYSTITITLYSTWPVPVTEHGSGQALSDTWSSPAECPLHTSCRCMHWCWQDFQRQQPDATLVIIKHITVHKVYIQCMHYSIAVFIIKPLKNNAKALLRNGMHFRSYLPISILFSVTLKYCVRTIEISILCHKMNDWYYIACSKATWNKKLKSQQKRTITKTLSKSQSIAPRDTVYEEPSMQNVYRIQSNISVHNWLCSTMLRQHPLASGSSTPR